MCAIQNRQIDQTNSTKRTPPAPALADAEANDEPPPPQGPPKLPDCAEADALDHELPPPQPP
jgi:hypothetical protein